MKYSELNHILPISAVEKAPNPIKPGSWIYYDNLLSWHHCRYCEAVAQHQFYSWFWNSYRFLLPSKHLFTCSNSTVEVLGKGVKYAQSEHWKCYHANNEDTTNVIWIYQINSAKFWRILEVYLLRVLKYLKEFMRVEHASFTASPNACPLPF